MFSATKGVLFVIQHRRLIHCPSLFTTDQLHAGFTLILTDSWSRTEFRNRSMLIQTLVSDKDGGVEKEEEDGIFNHCAGSTG